MASLFKPMLVKFGILPSKADTVSMQIDKVKLAGAARVVQDSVVRGHVNRAQILQLNFVDDLCQPLLRRTLMAIGGKRVGHVVINC